MLRLCNTDWSSKLYKQVQWNLVITEFLGSMKISLLIRFARLYRVKKLRNIKSWDSKYYIRCLHGDISAISQLYSRSRYQTSSISELVTLERLSIYFWNMENFLNYQYSRLPPGMFLHNIKLMYTNW